MKTDPIKQNPGSIYSNLEKAKSEEMATTKVQSEKTEQIEKNFPPKISQVDSVKKEIADSIEWRDMKFYRHEEKGQIYVDIVDRESGKVIKTIPETEFMKVASQIKTYSGITLDING